MATELGTLQRVELREVWEHEQYHFTPWLCEASNLAILGETLGIELEFKSREHKVGPYAADIVCSDALEQSVVLIENQLGKTDHSHLGQLLTYAAGLEAKTVIWIAERFTDEHRAAIDWLNEITAEEYEFFGLEIELWRIGTSLPAPRFNVVCRPNGWSRAVREETARVEATSPNRIFKLAFWTGFKKWRSARGLPAPKPAAESWQNHSIGRTGFTIEAVVGQERREVGVRLYIHCQDLPPKAVFHYFRGLQGQIEPQIGLAMVWDDLPGKKSSVIRVPFVGAPLDDEARWPECYQWLSDAIQRMDAAFRPLIRDLQRSDLPEVGAGAEEAEGQSE